MDLLSSCPVILARDRSARTVRRWIQIGAAAYRFAGARGTLGGEPALEPVSFLMSVYQNPRSTLGLASVPQCRPASALFEKLTLFGSVLDGGLGAVAVPRPERKKKHTK